MASAVSLRDLGATVLDLTGMRATTRFPGQSFAPLMTRDAPAPARPLFADLEKNPSALPDGPNQFGAMEAIFSDRFQYVRNFGTGRQELFDYVADPTNARDLSATPVGRGQMASIRALGNPRGGQP